MLLLLRRLLKQGTRAQALALVGLAVFLVLAGGIAFAIVEHQSVWIGWYWAVTTATTVGYGDVTPKTPAGHVIAVVVMLSTIPLLGAVFALWSGTAAALRLR
ncbi:MAG: potassium channel family protein, partial [Acidimicrobiales bacterium]